MDYEAAVDYLRSLSRFGIKPGLERTEALLQSMGNPERSMAHVHIAGTNGKGSVSVMVESALEEAGHVSGLLTSPHLQRYTERIKVGGSEISQQQLAELVGEMAPVIAKLSENENIGTPTEFEALTAACFEWFMRSGVEIAVVETGLGGTYDSTNVVTPEVSVITHIAMDHMDRLGNTLSEIASNKAGIIKPGVPVVVSPQDPEAMAVIVAKANEVGAEVTVVGMDVPYEPIHMDLDGTTVDVDAPVLGRLRVHTPLVGRHQVTNCATAVAALDVLEGLKGGTISPAAVCSGIGKACHPGRFEVVRKSPYVVILDGAHNLDGAASLAATLHEIAYGLRPRVMVFGTSRDKPVREMLAALVPEVDVVIATAAVGARTGAHDPEFVASVAREMGVEAHAVASACEAVQAGARIASAIGAKSLLVAGSLYLVGEVRGIWRD
ncbi:MAG: bifunctional folylpolyglutamate synthase/dihydrofolate synthase [Bacillota bacterium]